jgi:hypothetical protein
MLLDDEGSHLVFCLSAGENADAYTGGGEYEKAVRVPMSGSIGINPLVVLYGKPICMREGDPRHYPEVDRIVGTHTRSLYAIPLATQERVVGTFSAINAHLQDPEGISAGFSMSDMESMNAAAEAVRLWLTFQMEVLLREPEDLRSA